MERAALIVSLAERLQAHASGCGETQLQKAAYLVQDLTDVLMGFEFALYTHGPQIAPTDENERFRYLFLRTLKEHVPARVHLRSDRGLFHRRIDHH
jgi:hypothetical protein